MSEKTCLYPPCNDVVHCRGLCRTHYQQAARLVKANKVTWETLIEQGKAISTRHRTDPSELINWLLDPKTRGETRIHG